MLHSAWRCLTMPQKLGIWYCEMQKIAKQNELTLLLWFTEKHNVNNVRHWELCWDLLRMVCSNRRAHTLHNRFGESDLHFDRTLLCNQVKRRQKRRQKRRECREKSRDSRLEERRKERMSGTTGYLTFVMKFRCSFWVCMIANDLGDEMQIEEWDGE